MHAITIPNLVVALMGSVVAAQTSSVANLYLLGFDSDEDQPLFVGSIIASDATATTYSITCGSVTAAPKTTSSSSSGDDFGDECGVPESFTFVQGPSTIKYKYNYTMYDAMTGSATAPTSDYGQATYIVGCDISTSASVAYCSGNNLKSLGTQVYSTAESTSLTGTDYASLLSGVPVTITAGPTSGSAIQTSSGAAATGAGKSSASRASAFAGSSTSTGGMPMITAKPQWIAGGAAAAMVMSAW